MSLNIVGKHIRLDGIGLFVKYMLKMLKFYRDILDFGFFSKWRL